MTTHSGQAVRSYRHLIDGAWTSGQSEGVIERRNPANGELVAEFAAGVAADAVAAARSVRAGFDTGPWPRMTGMERARVLLEWARLLEGAAEELAEIEAREVGKPLRMARGDVAGTVEFTRFAAGLAMNVRGDSHDDLGERYLGVVTREPVGAVAAITAWNFPLLIYGQKVPFALAAGCTVVVKPSELASGTALEATRLALEAGVPADALAIVTGYGPVVGQALAESPDVDMISFTGSTRTGRTIATAPSPNLKRFVLELGGKGATIVFDDADLDDAIDGALLAAYHNQGEVCTAGTRLLVQESIADAFVAELARRAAELRVGDPFDERTDVGALIHEEHLGRVMDYVAGAAADGARLVTGGRRLTDAPYDAGCFVEPTVLDGVDPASRIFREEVFGPVLSATRFSDEAEAIALANASTYGLADSVWTKGVDRALSVARRLRSGTVWVNTSQDGAVQLPTGGYKASGYGRANGQVGLDAFTELKTIQLHLGKRAPFYGRG